jgi:2-aminoethylphosphonate dioxygenase
VVEAGVTIPEASDLGAAADAYAAAGVVVWRDLLPRALVERCRAACRAAWPAALADPEGWRTRYRSGPDGPVVDRIDPIRHFAPEVAEAVDHPDVLAVAAVGCGGPAVAYKDKYIEKLPGTGGYGLHQDLPYAHLDVEADALAQVFIPLGEFSRRNGATEVAPGAHTELLSPPGEVADVREGAVPEDALEPLELRPGDVALLHFLLPHRSPANDSGEPRPLLAGNYVRSTVEDAWTRYYDVYRRRSLADNVRYR